MKRFILFFALLVLLILPVCATENNAFFNLHAADCVYDGRAYLLNDPSGFIAVLDAPNGDVQHNLLNEQKMIVYGIYTDSTGSLWAQLRYSELSRGLAVSDTEGEYIGWAPLSSFYREPDKDDFLALHKDEFVNRPVRLRLSEHPDATLWAYPGAEQPSGYLRWYVRDNSALLSFPSWWEDGNGLRWGLWEDFFVCLDRPAITEAALGDGAVFYPAVSLERLPLPPEKAEEEQGSLLLPLLLLASALLLIALSFVIRNNTYFERKYTLWQSSAIN